MKRKLAMILSIVMALQSIPVDVIAVSEIPESEEVDISLEEETNYLDTTIEETENIDTNEVEEESIVLDEIPYGTEENIVFDEVLDETSDETEETTVLDEILDETEETTVLDEMLDETEETAVFDEMSCETKEEISMEEEMNTEEGSFNEETEESSVEISSNEEIEQIIEDKEFDNRSFENDYEEADNSSFQMLESSKQMEMSNKNIAASDFDYEELNGSYIAITGYTGSETDIEIPEMIGEYIVQEISSNAFENAAITSITLPKTLKRIGSSAFEGCSNLSSFDASNIVEIYDSAFRNCTNLSQIVFSDNLTRVDSYAFYGCTGLTEVNLSDSVTSIGYRAFANCTELSSFRYPTSWINGDEKIFEGDTKLTGIVVPEGVTALAEAAFKYCTNFKEISLPSTLKTIGTCSLEGCTGLTEITIPDSVTKIWNYGLKGCTGLKDLKLPDTLDTLGYQSLMNCTNLESVNFPSALSSCDEKIYAGDNKLTSIVVPEGVEVLPDAAFKNCTNFKSITLPSTLKAIGNAAIEGCTGLKNIEIPERVTELGDKALKGCTGLTSLELPDGITRIGYQAMMDCTGLKSVNYPVSLKNAEKDIFRNDTALKNITVPEGVSMLPEAVFDGCSNFTRIVLPKSLKTIGSYAFQSCTGLERMELPENVESIGYRSFARCIDLTSIWIGEKVTEIDNDSFASCSMDTLVIHGADGSYAQAWAEEHGVKFSPENIGDSYSVLSGRVTTADGSGIKGVTVSVYSVTDEKLVDSIQTDDTGTWTYDSAVKGDSYRIWFSSEKYRFEPQYISCLADTETMPETVVGTAILDGIDENDPDDFAYETLNGSDIMITSFSGNGDTVVIPAEIDGYVVKELGKGVFEDNAEIKKVKLPFGLTTIGYYAFKNCTSLESIYMSGSIASIGKAAFNGCTALTKVDFPGNLTRVDSYAFYGCTGLTEVNLPDSVTSIGYRAFANCTELSSFRYPASWINGDEKIFEGDTKLTDIVVPEGVTALAEAAFKYCTNFKEISLPSTLKTIGTCSLEGCTGLTEITIPDSVTKIWNYGLKGCTGLKVLKLPDTLDTLGYQSLMNCTNLESVNFPSALSSCDEKIYAGDNKLTSIVVPEGVEVLPDAAFKNCTNFKSITLPSTLKVIGNAAIEGCTGLKNIEIPERVTELGNKALKGCTGLTSLELPDGITRIGYQAMMDCTELKSVNYPVSLKKAEKDIFRNDTALKNMMIPAGVEEIPEYTFYNANGLRTIAIPGSLKAIGNYAFYGCKGLPGIILGEAVESIGNYAFYSCTGIISVTIPESVTFIGDYSFAFNNNLKSVYTTENIEYIDDHAFDRTEALLYVVENTYAAKWAIDHDIDFEYISNRSANYDNYMLDMSKSAFYSNSNLGQVNNYLTLYLDYTIKTEYANTIKDKQIGIRLSSNLLLTNGAVKVDNDTNPNYEYEDGVLRIPVNNNSGSIRINVKPLSSGKFSAYAYFAYVKDNKKQNELINTITMSVPVITIEAKSPTSNATISVSGVAEPSKKVNIYVDNKIAGSVKAKKNGMYVMNLQLHNPVNSHVYKIEAQEDYDQTIKADISVVYNEATPELTKFDMYYQAHEWLKMDLLSTIGTKQAVSIYPGYPFTFMIKYDNPDQIYKVYVVSSKNGKNMYLEAEPTANKGEFIATGYFDENNKNYIPGSIGIKYINKVGQEIYNYPLKSNNEFISDELKNVETEITEDQEEYGAVQLKLENGSTMDVTIARTSEAKLRTRYLSEKRSDRKKVATLTASVSTDEQDVINFFNDFRKKLGDRLIEDRDDFVLAWNENRTEIIYILWDATHDTFMEVGIKYAPTWMMEDTLNTIGYYEHGMTNAQIASQYAPVLVGELTAFYKGINGYNDYQTILREIKDSDMSESEKAYAIKKVENTEVAFGVISALRVALPLIKMGVTAYNPVLGAVGAVVVDEALNLYEKYLMNKADYYKNEGIGEYTFINWLIDPSGYVYEAVQQNRIQGAKVTAYYKENLEDKAVIWNASEFSQKNPLYSDSEGYYAWDTPEGYWQVKVEKEGYETWTSEWLSVPPVQNNINVPLVSKSVPTVEWINVYEEYAEIHFTKYMKPGNMNEIKVLDDKNHEIPYSISYSKENTSEDGTVYANTFRLIFSEPLQKRQKCIVIVPGKLQSYSGITCAEKTYTKTVKSPCAIEIAEDVTVDYGSQITIPITLDSYDEAAEINAVSACPNLARVVSVEKSDLDGVWNVIIEGRLPGETKIMISVKDTDIEQTVSVSIKMNNTFKGFDEDVHKHSWDKGIISQKATCTKVGKKLFTCIDCKETWIQEIPVDKEAHTFSTVIDKKVTCGTAGKQHRVCVECNYKEAAINIPATGKHKLVFKVDRSPTCGAAGRKHKECSICGHKETAVNIPATGKHKYGSYVISQKPTVLKKGTKIRICSVCKKKDIALMPKLTPSIKLNVTNITLKMNQSTTKIKVSNLAAGDKVKYWKSSNTKIVKVSNSGKITAQKKPGTATLTVVLLSGKKTTIKVKVQKGDVKTTKILGLAKTATMKVKKTLTLRPIISPITSTQKITYATSNKGIATVNSKGVITAKKPGKVKITVKSGAKKFVITVTVKK